MLTHSFSPAIGGIETVAASLCSGFTNHDHEVTLLTKTAGPSDHDAARPYRVVRQPTHHQVLRAISTADVVLHNNPVARWLWPSVVINRPTVIVHHTWLVDSRTYGLKNIKRRILARFLNVAVSDILARELTDLGAIKIVRNSFDAHTFPSRTSNCTDDFVFVGRLVTDKGCDLLLDAWQKASGRLGSRSLRIIGDGPELGRLQQQTESLQLDNVRFLGPLTPIEVGRHLRDCRTLVAPSRWREPFGLVALEAAASGCQVIAPSDTGLVEAAGPALIEFTRGDSISLSQALTQAAQQPVPDPSAVRPHLDRHREYHQIQNYLQILESARRTGGRRDVAQENL